MIFMDFKYSLSEKLRKVTQMLPPFIWNTVLWDKKKGGGSLMGRNIEIQISCLWADLNWEL